MKAISIRWVLWSLLSIWFIGFMQPMSRHLMQLLQEGIDSVRSWKRQQILIAIGICLQNVSVWVSYSVITPFFPIEAASKHASKKEVGVVFGIYDFVIFLASPIFGKYLNKIGVKLMFISGSVLLGVSSIVFAFLNACPDGIAFVIMCIAIRAIAAFGSSMLSVSSFTLMGKAFPNNTGKAFGIVETFSGIGFGLGPLIGGSLYSLGGFQLPFLVIGSLVCLNTILCFLFLPSLTGNFCEKQVSTWKLFKIPGCVIAYIVITVCCSTNAFRYPTLAKFWKDQIPTISVTQIGLLLSIPSVMYTLFASAAGILSDRGWHASSILTGMTLFSSFFLFLGPSSIFQGTLPFSLTMTGITLGGIGISYALIVVPVFPLLVKMAKNSPHSTDETQILGLISGLFNSAYSLGGFLGPTAAGYLYNEFGFPISTSMCSALLLCTACLFFSYVLIMAKYGKWPIAEPKQPNAVQDNRSNHV